MSAVATVKVVPDMGEFAARLTQELSLDDPLARAIIAESQYDPAGFNTFVAFINSGVRSAHRTFALHHWTLIAATETQPQRLATSWVETTDDLAKY